jgi:transcriptional regulator with XRE-family HTH domain
MSASLLGQIVKRQRQLNNWSQEELARRIGGNVDQTVVSRLENGHIEDPGGKFINRLARALNVRGDDLLDLLCQGDTDTDAPQVPTADDNSELADVRQQMFKLLTRLGELEQKEKVTSGKAR